MLTVRAAFLRHSFVSGVVEFSRVPCDCFVAGKQTGSVDLAEV